MKRKDKEVKSKTKINSTINSTLQNNLKNDTTTNASQYNIENNSYSNSKTNEKAIIKTSNKDDKKGFVKKLLSNKIISKFLTKEIILYAIFGVLTTVVNIGSFYVMTEFLHINENTANNIAIILAVLVAYFTNKDLVFHSEAQGFGEKLIEFCKFILGRLLTMFIESFGGSLMFKYLPIPTIISKCLITIIVIILNFFISKFFAFKSSNKDIKID